MQDSEQESQEARSSAVETAEEQRRRVNRRRFKAQTSCTICRAKKLKCDRKQPCKNCLRRPPGSCVYVTPPSNLRSQVGLVPSGMSGSTANVQDRINRLEQLIQSLAQRQTTDEEPATNISGQPVNTPTHATLGNVRPDVSTDFGHLSVNEAETRFVSPSHWEAILGNITEIKDAVNANLQTEEYGPSWFRQGSLPTPELLFAGNKDISLAELVSSLPPKSAVDQLAQGFTDVEDLPLLVTHLPTFMNEYEEFWRRPQTASLIWLSMLHSIMSLSLQWMLRSGKRIESITFPELSCHLFIQRAVQCLRLSNYTKPRKYTIEALMYYLACEHFRMPNGDFRASVVFSMIVRLAFRAGYHRDPIHYPEMSIFEGEMRRRVWAAIVDLDFVFNSSCGLPRLIDNRQTDTSSPVNATDQDIWPEMTEMPEARALTEQTWVGHLNFKTRMLAILGRIVDHAGSVQNMNYEEVLSLDKELAIEYNNKPLWLAIPSDGSLTTVSPLHLSRLVQLDLISLRARMMLHRKFFGPMFQDSRYQYSHQTCLLAASQALSYQHQIHQAFRNSDIPVGVNWRYICFMSHDFLLAAIVVFMSFQLTLREPESEVRLQSLNNKYGLLENSYFIWSEAVSYSHEARTAVQILDVLLQKIRPGGSLGASSGPSSHTNTPGQSMGEDESMAYAMAQPNMMIGGYHQQQQQQQQHPVYHFEGAPTVETPASTGMQDFDFEQMIRGMDNFDWAGWDSHFQGAARYSW